ncbi:HTH-type transcriptional activator IlvY [Alteromonadaceae bacterium M269]|nr:HTH-type transcriptional activator IlvY [Alteromonadaceae bacterium M269]
MNLKEIKIFQHLAHSLHFGKTAEAHYLSPSALSRTIQRLEQDCGCTLLVRNNRSVGLTDAGHKLLAFANKWLAEWQELKSELDANNQILSGSMSLYCSVTASFSHLPGLLDRFHTNFPQVETHIQTGDPGLSIERVLNRQVDVAIAVKTPDFPSALDFHLIDVVPLIMIAPKDSAIKAIDDIDWRSQPVVLPEVGPSKRLVNAWLKQYKIEPNVYASIGGNEAIVSMVALGCGVAIVPDIVVQNSAVSHKIQCITIDDIEPFELGICVLERRKKEPVIQALLGLINTESNG